VIFRRLRHTALLRIPSLSVSILYTQKHRKKVRLILRCDLSKNFSQILGQNRGVANTRVRLVVWKIRYSYLKPHCYGQSHSVLDMLFFDVDQGAGAVKSARNIVTPAYICRLSDMRVLIVEWQPAGQQVY